jgi:hypothetical protein
MAFPQFEDDGEFTSFDSIAIDPPAAVTHDFDQGPMAPIPLAQDYQIEKAFGGRVMPDYLKELLTHYGSLENIPELTLLENYFRHGKVKGTPRGAAAKPLFSAGISAPVDPQAKQLVEWGDRLFFSVPSWPRSNDADRNLKIFRILNSLCMGVKYCIQMADRNRFRIEIHGRQLWRREQLFDTRELMEHYGRKGNYEMTGEVIWVLSKEPEEFYSHVGKLGRVHHSSFFAGDEVRAGGDWRVEQGVIREISGRSGHYKPGIGHFIQALRMLQARGAFGISDEIILVWGNYPGGPLERVSLQALEKNPDWYKPSP